MKKISAVAVLMALAAFAATAVAAEPAKGDKGEAIFKEKCMACHPDGGNIINPKETLKGIKDPKKITSKIRKGGGGMTAFDAKAISDADAKAVADYIIKTFKK
jgi:cytochrome c6